MNAEQPGAEAQVQDASKAEPQAFTWSALGGISGAAMAVTVVSGTLSTAFDWQYPRWLPLLIALVVVVLADVAPSRERLSAVFRNPFRPVLWGLNACIAFMTAVGGTHLVTGSQANTSETQAAAASVASAATSEPAATPHPAVTTAVPSPSARPSAFGASPPVFPPPSASTHIPFPTTLPPAAAAPPASHDLRGFRRLGDLKLF
jgi:hypothetical protein